jgi:hypothetical protein
MAFQRGGNNSNVETRLAPSHRGRRLQAPSLPEIRRPKEQTLAQNGMRNWKLSFSNIQPLVLAAPLVSPPTRSHPRAERIGSGAGPHIRTLTPSSATRRAAPLAALFGEWAPWSLVTDKARSSVIDVADADQPASLLRRWIPSLHHYELLSAKSAAGHAAESRSVSSSLRAGAAAARFRGGWIRCDA